MEIYYNNQIIEHLTAKYRTEKKKSAEKIKPVFNPKEIYYNPAIYQKN